MELLKANYEYGGFTYLVYSNGDIYGPTGKRLKHRKNDDGYAVVTMGNSKVKRSTQFVHRIVATLFIPNPDNLSDVDHMDNNRMNPDMYNLKWSSHEDNVKRAYARGAHVGRAIGEKNPRARLTPEKVLKFRAEYKTGTTIQEMVEKYGFPWTTICNAIKGITWKHLPL